MTGEFGAMCSLQDMKANRAGSKETIGWLITWTGFMLFSLKDLPFDVQVGHGDETLTG